MLIGLAAVAVPLTLLSGSRSAWLAAVVAGLVLVAPAARAPAAELVGADRALAAADAARRGPGGGRPGPAGGGRGLHRAAPDGRALARVSRLPVARHPGRLVAGSGLRHRAGQHAAGPPGGGATAELPGAPAALARHPAGHPGRRGPGRPGRRAGAVRHLRGGGGTLADAVARGPRGLRGADGLRRRDAVRGPDLPARLQPAGDPAGRHGPAGCRRGALAGDRPRRPAAGRRGRRRGRTGAGGGHGGRRRRGHRLPDGNRCRGRRPLAGGRQPRSGAPPPSTRGTRPGRRRWRSLPTGWASPRRPRRRRGGGAPQPRRRPVMDQPGPPVPRAGRPCVRPRGRRPGGRRGHAAGPRAGERGDRLRVARRHRRRRSRLPPVDADHLPDRPDPAVAPADHDRR